MCTHRRTFPGRPANVRDARHWALRLLANDLRADDAALIVTELAGNATRHTASGDQGGTFHVALDLTARALTISVTDSGTAKTTPHIDRPTTDDPHGRGLAIVTALADHLEVRGDEAGHTVIARLLQRQTVASTTC
ncbi:ATP-binding protein [Streptomyces sp. PTM05]|uniref:ATP-binding protein n=1 Tax=Streptantibioticus parmotrematis TaxID=2873249 RepID=A0ABS7QRJ7_9ACTN|nr:ATP-binding protein [Streptantibioticus parmotrematis]MBY8885000.1 ATP-binding protein [Streptantibioticus parmotrematis]